MNFANLLFATHNIEVSLRYAFSELPASLNVSS